MHPHRAITFIAAVTLVPLASAQELRELKVVRTDPTSAEDSSRRRLTLTIRADWGVAYQAELRLPKPGSSELAWEGRQFGNTAIPRKARQQMMLGLIAGARAANPSGNISGALSAAEKAGLPLTQVTIDGVSFELNGSVYATPALKAGVGPLMAELEAMLEAHLPPPSLYTRLIYRRGARVLEISPTGTTTVTTGGEVINHQLTEGPKKKIQALIKESGLFLPANQGKTVQLLAARPIGDSTAAAFALEVQPLRTGAPWRVAGTVGTWKREDRKAGALVDELESILNRIVLKHEEGTAAAGGGGTGGMGGALRDR